MNTVHISGEAEPREIVDAITHRVGKKILAHFGDGKWGDQCTAAVCPLIWERLHRKIHAVERRIRKLEQQRDAVWREFLAARGSANAQALVHPKDFSLCRDTIQPRHLRGGSACLECNGDYFAPKKGKRQK